jgi:hypothetical protein
VPSGEIRAPAIPAVFRNSSRVIGGRAADEVPPDWGRALRGEAANPRAARETKARDATRARDSRETEIFMRRRDPEKRISVLLERRNRCFLTVQGYKAKAPGD